MCMCVYVCVCVYVCENCPRLQGHDHNITTEKITIKGHECKFTKTSSRLNITTIRSKLQGQN